MKFIVYMKRLPTAPWVKVETTSSVESANRLVGRYQRDYPQANVQVVAE